VLRTLSVLWIEGIQLPYEHRCLSPWVRQLQLHLDLLRKRSCPLLLGLCLSFQLQHEPLLLQQDDAGDLLMRGGVCGVRTRAHGPEVRAGIWDDPGRAPRRVCRWVPVAASVAGLVAACVPNPSPRPPGPSAQPPAFTGRILAGNDQLVEYRLPSLEATRFQLPRFHGPPSGNVLSAFWGADERHAYALVQIDEDHSQLFLVGPHEDPRTLGPRLPATYTARGGGGLVLAWTCGRRAYPILALDPTEPAPRWREVARGCPAALSPDARFVAYSPDGRTIWQVAIDAGDRPRELLDLSRWRRQLRSAGMRDAELWSPFADIAWGDPGIAVTLADHGRYAILLRLEGGGAQLIPLGRAQPASGLAWQPNGALLAWSELAPEEAGSLRVYDPASREPRQLAAGTIDGVIWSPDGSLVAALRATDGTSQWVFLDVDGDLVGTAQIDASPRDWAQG